MTGTLEPSDTCTKLRRIAELAKEIQGEGLKNLSHYMDMAFLQEAYRRTRKSGAVGVDGVNAKQYEQDLEGNLRKLLERAKAGTYQAPPVRRKQIPKGSGKETRPIGIPTLEDKVLQRAVSMLLTAVYEGDFEDFSYGCRPGRSAHQALEGLWGPVMGMYGGWVIEVDIRKFFDTLVHNQLTEILRKRVLDGVVLRLIGKWLNAGVMEEGAVWYPEAGTPQGGVISPLLANIYLDEVVDKWWVKDILPLLRGKAALRRYVDDIVMVFEDRSDAERMMKALPKRFAKYGLTLHPEKTRMLPFMPPDKSSRDGGAVPPPGSFDFLGFTHFWGKSIRGKWIMKRKTAKDRLRRTLVRLNDWLREHRHKPVPWQQAWLRTSLRGHYAYFGITGNVRALQQLRRKVERLWHKWLSRRSGRGYIPWASFQGLLLRHPLPPVKVVQSIYRGA